MPMASMLVAAVPYSKSSGIVDMSDQFLLILGGSHAHGLHVHCSSAVFKVLRNTGQLPV